MTNTLLNKTKKDFVENAGAEKLPEKTEKKALRAPSRVKVFDPSKGLTSLELNVALLGIQGYGKTFALYSALKRGLRVFILNTDPGGGGHETLVAEAIKNNEKELLNNLRVLSISTYDDVFEFLENPNKVYEDFYSFAPQVLAWEGFSYFQQTDIYEKAGELYAETAKSTVETREGSYRFEQQDWGVVKQATSRTLDMFLNIRVPGVENLLRIVSVHEGINKVKKLDSKDQPYYVEEPSNRPNIQGAAQNLFSQGFCLSVRLTKKGNEFFYEINSEKSLGGSKKRGIDLPEKFNANFETVLAAIESSYGIKIG